MAVVVWRVKIVEVHVSSKLSCISDSSTRRGYVAAVGQRKGQSAGRLVRVKSLSVELGKCPAE